MKTGQALFGPYGGIEERDMDAFAASRANAIWFHMFNEKLFELCTRYGIAPCVEFKTFRANFADHPELIPLGADGKPIRYGKLVQGICLSRTEYLQSIEEGLRTGLSTYRPVGIWLDYLTCAGWFETPDPDLQESCFCPDCIAEFQTARHIDAADAGEILSRYATEWKEHKTDRIASFAARYAGIIRETLPECIVGAYMCPWTPGEYDGALGRIFAQDFGKLAPSIDIFTPLIYAHKSGRPAGWGREYLEGTGGFIPQGNGVQLILDQLDFPDSLMETASSAVPSFGLQIFGGKAIFSETARVRIFDEAVMKIEAALGENPSS